MVEPQPVRAAFPFYITPSEHGNLPGNTIQKRSCHWFCYGIPDSTNVVLRSIPIFCIYKNSISQREVIKKHFSCWQPGHSDEMAWHSASSALLTAAAPTSSARPVIPHVPCTNPRPHQAQPRARAPARSNCNRRSDAARPGRSWQPSGPDKASL